ncbi:MAG TPA: hypothetical protein VMH35_14125 [Streptosporangiaceae bacterium]|nr:hypothetical protein [Streptosporangiaceae bacterium]
MEPIAPPPRWAWFGAAVAVGAVTLAVLVARGRPSPGQVAVSVSAGPVSTVVFQGPPGQLSIVGEPGRGQQVTLTGQLHWAPGHRAAVATGPRQAGHVLRLGYRCAAGSPCTGSLRLVLPERTAIVLDQPAGHVTAFRLAGRLRITARSVDISATGLRSPVLAAVITSGHLNATFASPPRQLAVTLLSAQATVRLPRGSAYRLRQWVTSGYLDARVARSATARRTISAHITSGELSLLTW